MHKWMTAYFYIYIDVVVVVSARSSCATSMRHNRVHKFSLNDRIVLWFKNAPRETRWRNRDTHSQREHEEFLSILRILCGFFLLPLLLSVIIAGESTTNIAMGKWVCVWIIVWLAHWLYTLFDRRNSQHQQQSQFESKKKQTSFAVMLNGLVCHFSY